MSYEVLEPSCKKRLAVRAKLLRSAPDAETLDMYRITRLRARYDVEPGNGAATISEMATPPPMRTPPSTFTSLGVGEILPARCKCKIADANCSSFGRLAQEI